MSNKGDEMIERGAQRLDDVAEKAAAEGGIKGKLAGELAEDAAFLRKLKPSLIVERAKGNAPTNSSPSSGPAAPGRPQLGERPNAKKGGGPNPFVVLGAAFAIGVVLARIIDWRSHAHPKL